VTDDQGSETPFLSRWSDRKLRVRRGEEPADASPPEQADPVPGVESEETGPLLTDADMPPLESLDAQSDYSGFLSRGVSEALRREALSKLFRSPHLNVVDGLDDYAEDFTKFAPLGDVITADMRHRLEQAAERLLGEQEPRTAVAPVPEEDAEAAQARDDVPDRPERADSVGEKT
jgi:hypothetical protein